MAQAHVVSNQPASPTILAKSIATCPKARRNRSGFMRIGIKPSSTITGLMGKARMRVHVIHAWMI